jgi:hypothetical protein
MIVPEPAAGMRPERRRLALILCMSELGFVGGFNARLADAAKAAIEPEDQLFILGSRGAELAIEHGLQIAWSAPIATRPRGAPETVHVLADELYLRNCAKRNFAGRGDVWPSQQRCARGPAPTPLAARSDGFLPPTNGNGLAKGQRRSPPA